MALMVGVWGGCGMQNVLVHVFAVEGGGARRTHTCLQSAPPHCRSWQRCGACMPRLHFGQTCDRAAPQPGALDLAAPNMYV